MYIEQSLKGVELRNIESYSITYKFLEENFKGYFEWNAFDHKFFISDKCKGRHDTIKCINLWLQS